MPHNFSEEDASVSHLVTSSWFVPPLLSGTHEPKATHSIIRFALPVSSLSSVLREMCWFGYLLGGRPAAPKMSRELSTSSLVFSCLYGERYAQPPEGRECSAFFPSSRALLASPGPSVPEYVDAPREKADNRWRKLVCEDPQHHQIYIVCGPPAGDPGSRSVNFLVLISGLGSRSCALCPYHREPCVCWLFVSNMLALHVFRNHTI